MAQTAKAVLYSDSGGCVTEEILAPAAGEYGDVIQTADGRASVVLGADGASSAFSSGDKITVAKTGQFKVLKTSSVVLLAGGKAFWDRSAEKANYTCASGDFFLGRIVEDAASSDTEVIVDLNVEPRYAVELGKGRWTNGATDGLGVSLVAEGGPELKLAFDAVAEVAMAALYSVDTVPCADGPIFEGKIAIYDIGDDAALDINLGLQMAPTRLISTALQKRACSTWMARRCRCWRSRTMARPRSTRPTRRSMQWTTPMRNTGLTAVTSTTSRCTSTA